MPTQTPKEIIAGLYAAVFNRAPDKAGLDFWASQADGSDANATEAYQNIMDPAGDATGFVDHPVFIAAYSSLSNAEFAAKIYENSLGQAGDQEGINFWTAKLDLGLSRGDMVVSFVEGALTGDFTAANFPNLTAEELTAARERQDYLTNKVEVAVHWIAELGDKTNVTNTTDPTTDPAYIASQSVLEEVNQDPATVDHMNAIIDAASDATDVLQSIVDHVNGHGPSVAPDATFTLTTSTDSVPGLSSSAGNTDSTGGSTYIATEATLTSGDTIVDAGGVDTLRYASSGAVNVTESGFAIENVETIKVTSDVTGVATTTFDMTGVDGAIKYVNDNSSADLITTGVQNLVNVMMEDVSNGDTNIRFVNSVLAGTSDVVNLTLDNVQSDAGGALSAISVGNTTSVGTTGIETLNITTEGQASLLTSVVTGAATINVTGDQNLTVNDDIIGATSIDASAFTGNLNIDTDSDGTAKDVVVKGGTGNDFVDFSDGYESGDSFDGGAGTDTIGLSNAIATSTPGGTTTNVEQLAVSDAASGTIDMNSFPGVTKVILDGGMGGDVIIDDAVTGITVEVDPATATANDLTVDLKTDGTADEITVEFDDVADAALTGVVTADDAETLNLNVSKAATGTSQDLTIANLSATDATTLNIVSDAALDLTAANTTALTTVNAVTSTGNLDLENLDLAAVGATVTLGSGDDTILSGAGADTLTGNGGKDTFKYTNANQSDNAGTDTIKDFVSGTDSIDLKTLAPNAVVSSDQFRGVHNDFGSAQGALRGSAADAAPGLGDTVFEANFDGNGNGRLWVDTDGDGTLSNTDLRIVMEGVSTITATDLGLGVAGNTITLDGTAAAVISTTSSTGANTTTTDSDDTINTSIANLDAMTSIDGGLGQDTLVLTDAGALGGVDAAGLTNIESITLANGTNTALEFHIDGVFTTVIGGTGSDTITNTANLDAGGTISLGAGNDVITALSADLANTTIDLGAGDDAMTSTVAAALTLTSIDGGVGTDTLTLNNAASDITAVAVSNFENLIMSANGTMTLAQYNSFTGTVTNTASIITLSDAGTVNSAVGSMTLADGTNTVNTASALATQTITGGTGADTVILSGGFDTTDSFTLGDGTDTLEIAYDVTAGIDVGTAPGTIIGVENLVISATQTGGGAITLAAEADLLTLDTTSATNDFVVDSVLAGMTSVKLGAGDDTLIAVVANTAEQRIELGAGDDIIIALSVGAENQTIDFGTGTGTITNIVANGAGVLELEFEASTTSTTSASITTGDDFNVNDIIDFSGNVTSVVTGVANGTTGVNGAIGQLFIDSITNPANTILTYDADGSQTFSAGDIQITIVGNVISGGINADSDFLIGASA